MNQVVQNVRTGVTSVREIPSPLVQPGHVLVDTRVSLISAGTERSVINLAQKTLLGKALNRPDHVRRILQKVKAEGLRTTLQQVSGKLTEPMPLGYSTSGVVLAAGRDVEEFKPGDRVSSVAPHAGVVAAGRNLCAKVPDNVTFEQAAYTSVAAIGLQGLRLAHLTLGSRVVVIGMGLIGQMCVAMAKAQGCAVFATDLDASRLEVARAFGADAVGIGAPVEAVRNFSGGAGVDAVIITAATESNAPIEFSADVCRRKGRIVLIGVVGLNIPRPPFFEKELEFTVSYSLGPGRGDPAYEEKGHDYPIGYVRWTAQRNMEIVLGLMSVGKLPVERLTTHRFPIKEAHKAYDLITSGTDTHFGVVLEYPAEQPNASRRLTMPSSRTNAGDVGISVIGAGNFARLMMMPILRNIKDLSWRGICTAKGLSAEDTAQRIGFCFSTTDVDEIFRDPATRAVFIATRHNLHAELVIAALRAGKHVFVEKPLCITTSQLEAIRECIADMDQDCPLLMVGFNRRFAPATEKICAFLAGTGPKTISYRFATGRIPADHWTQDDEVGGGRIVGETCHAIDTCVALAGSIPVRVYAESVSTDSRFEKTDDKVFILLRHLDGSVSSISYQSDGAPGFAGERIEVFGGARAAVNESWDQLQLWSGNCYRRARTRKDKGHAAELRAFVDAVRQGGPWPISWIEMHAVTWASLMAVQSLREGIPLTYQDEAEFAAAGE